MTGNNSGTLLLTTFGLMQRQGNEIFTNAFLAALPSASSLLRGQKKLIGNCSAAPLFVFN